MVFSYTFSPQSQTQRLIWAGSLITLPHECVKSEYPVAEQEIWSDCRWGRKMSLETRAKHFHTHLQPLILLMFSRVFWDPDSLPSPLDSTFRTPQVWAVPDPPMQGRQAEVLFSRQLHRNDSTWKAAESQVHYSIIQENVNTKSLMPGGLCR